MEKKMKMGEIVWAKVRGFPWWPGKIGKIEESKCANQESKILVNFIGDPTHAEIPISKIEKFEKNFEEFSKTKKKNLINAINLASKIFKEENNPNNAIDNTNCRKQTEKNFIKIKEERNINHQNIENKERRIKFLNKKRLRKSIDLDYLDKSDSVGKRIRLNSKLIRSRKQKERDNENEMKERDNKRLNRGKNKIKQEQILKEKHDSNFSEMEDSEDESESYQDKHSSDESYSSEEESESISPSTELVEKIHQLVFSKIEMPSSSSNKSILTSFESIEYLLDKVNQDDLFDLTKDLFPYLSCSLRNKNPNISSKAINLSNTIKEAITKNVFFLFDKISSQDEADSQIDTEGLNKILTKKLEENKLASNNNLNQPKISKLKRIGNSKNEILHKDLLNTKISYRILKSNFNSKDEELTMSEEISLDSHKTDCEDSKSNYKYKIHVTCLDRLSLFNILKDYFVEHKLQNESDFFCKLFKGELFNFQEKSAKPIKNHYMRRRVCYKLYRLNKESLENKFIKDLSIYLELKAREKDVTMCHKYKYFVSNIFSKIKEEIISSIH